MKFDKIMNESLKSDLIAGFKAVVPVCLGYIPLGVTFGVLAQKAGLTPVEVAFMSFIVFAGGSQFIAVAMFTEYASMMSIIFTTFMVNLRHFLMGSSLSVFLKGESKLALTFFSHTITDESFVINTDQFQKKAWNLRRALIVSYTAYLAWIFSTVIGAFSGRFIPENALGMDYALTAMFLGLLVFQIKSQIHLATGIIAGTIACIVSINLSGNSYIIIGSVTAAGIGAVLNNKVGKKVER